MASVSTSALAMLALVLLVATILTVVLAPRGVEYFSHATGRAISDTGYVNLTINISLAIQVDPSNSSVVFGGCIPRPATSYYCASNDLILCDDNNTEGNCTGDTLGEQFIRIDNVGGVDVNVTVQSSCDASELIGGTNPLFQYLTTHCNGTAQSTWQNFSNLVYTAACSNVSYQGGQFRLYANVTIPSDAVGGSGACQNLSTIIFSGVLA